jgi:hypothetical protein
LIHAKIVREDAKYKTPTINEKEMEMVVPRDIFLPQKKLRKGEQGIVTAKVCIPQTCFLPGDHIPFILDVHHIAPVKQVPGTQVELERIITIRSENIQSVHNTVVQKQILPLICDTDTLASSISSKMPKIPTKIPPTIDCDSNIPISIQYRMRIMINMDMQHLSEDIPIRKRDRAYSVVTKVMGSLEEEDGPTFFYGSTITMELPIVIGTTSNTCISPIRSPTDRYSLPTSIMTTNAGELLPHINVTSPSSYITEDEKYVQKSKYRFDSDPISKYASNLILEPAYDFARMADVIHRPPSAPPLNDLDDDFHRQTLEEPSPPPYLEDPNTPDTLSTCTS